MSEYTRGDAAERAGVSLDDIDRFVELGIVRPDGDDRFTSGAVRKVGLAAALQSGGLPLDGIADQIRDGHLSLDFLENPVFDHFSALSPTTFADLSVESGIPIELLTAIREAVGSAMPLPTDRVREIELPIVRLIEAELRSGYAPAVVERLLRTMGDSLRRYVLAEADAFRLAVIEPVAAHGTGEEIGAAGASATERLTGPTLETLLAIFRAQQAHAWTANILEGFERDLQAAGLVATAERHPAMCFLDITGYTRLTDERGDEAAAELAEQLGAPGPAELGPARWTTGEVAGRRGHVLVPRSRAWGGRCPRDGGGRDERRAAAGPRRAPRRTGPVPGRRLLRADGEPRIAHRRLRATR